MRAFAAIRKPPGAEAAVFVAQDLVGVQPIVAVSGLPGFKPSAQPVLATDKVRHVGEAIAVCVASSRAEAEDLAAAVDVEFDELPPVVDMRAALTSEIRLHEHWDNNVFLETFVEVAPERFAQPAPIVVRRRLRTARQCMSPLEGRGVVATWDRRLEQLLVYSSTQMPHIVRTGLAGCLGLDQGRIRVVAPDVGGGFGYKGILLPEEVCAAYLARRLGHPVRWIEDRREQLTGNANCREHDYDITLHAEADGTLIGIDAEAVVDAGAYSAYPFSACLEAAQVASILPGPYVMQAYRCRTFSAATNKPPILPYRGVARSGVCFALEVTLDAVARQAGLEPHEVRLRNLVPRGGDAVREHHRQTLRQRRLSRMPAPRHRRDRSARLCVADRRRRPVRCASASAAASSASRRRTARRSMPAGAFRWCRASSRRSRA